MLIRLLRAILPLLIFAGAAWVAWWFYAHQPEQQMTEMPSPLVRVEGVTLKPVSHQVKVRTQGMVQARTRSPLLPEVEGKIITVSPAFNEGGFFAKGDVLLTLDPVDYQTALTVAQATLAQAETLAAEEEAKSAQAAANWKATGHSGQPNALVARTPQLKQAKAEVESARAKVQQAQRNLQRCQITAPYDGQVLEQTADLGQRVNPSTVLATLFATDCLEVRLPLPERDVPFLKLPEHYRDDANTTKTQPTVQLSSKIGTSTYQWPGRIVRVESAIDNNTRQIMAVAQIDDPFRRSSEAHKPPLRIGQFVEAEIQGIPLQNILLIPRVCVRAGYEVILITPQHTLRRANLQPLTGDEKHLVISADQPKGPKAGEVLCLTPIPFPADGAKVEPTIDGVATIVQK